MAKQITQLQSAEKYTIDNIPISDAIKAGAKQGNTTDQLSILLRAMGMLEFNLEEFKESINKRFDDIDERLRKMETGATEREIRISILEKHDSLQYRAIYGAILITIGMLIGWALHTLI